MKTHTYFLSGKALAVVAGALTASGALVFVVGVFVGILIQEPLQRATGGVLPAAAAPASAPIASTDNTAATPSQESPAAWPFSVPAADPAPAGADSAAAAPADSAPARAKAKPDTATHRRAVSDAAYVVPSEDAAPRRVAPQDNAPYTIRVGTFRVDRNAAMLVERLKAAGYKPLETTRVEGGRELHVVTVGGYVGRLAAIMAAERIGNKEQLVASIVPMHSRR